MSFFKFVISDLHIADGHAILDAFSERQQSALEELLSAAQKPGLLEMLRMLSLSSLLIALIFLLFPYKTDGLTDSSIAIKELPHSGMNIRMEII